MFNMKAYFAQVTDEICYFSCEEERGFQGGLWESNTNRALLSYLADNSCLLYRLSFVLGLLPRMI